MCRDSLFTTENTRSTERGFFASCLLWLYGFVSGRSPLHPCSGRILPVSLVFLFLTMIFFLFLTMISGAALAQSNSSSGRFLVNVEVESAIIREHPSEEAGLAASAFEDQKLEAVGRNIDGTWLEVRRPGRLNNLGWIFGDIVSYDFRIERLPLTDGITGLQGPVPPHETGFAAFINESVVLRTRPFYEGERITSLPYGVTVPVLERDSTNQWIKVNYLGFEGWVIYFAARPMLNLPDVPVSALRSETQVQVVIIPPEVQRAHVQRIREFIAPRLQLAINLEGFWQQVVKGELMPCSAPPFEIPFQYTQNDVRELPEIARYAPRLAEATDYLNQAIQPLTICGALPAKAVLDARNAATNARILYTETLKALDITESQIR